MNPHTPAPILAEMWRGDFLETTHRGHVVVADADGQIVFALGEPEAVVLPRSSIKMLQALPLVESGAAAAAGIGPAELALACASHNGAAAHTERVAAWLAAVDLGADDLRCGAQIPADKDARAVVWRGDGPSALHNNCSGKHTGFLTLARHLGRGARARYVAADHPVQLATREAFEAMCDRPAPGYAIDGCAAPNFAARMCDVAAAMARMARPGAVLGQTRQAAAGALVEAMMAHPLLVAGEGRACTTLIRALGGKGAVKTGAEGYFTAILREPGFGVALKIEDGNTRAAEAAMAAVLVRLGALSAEDPAAKGLMAAPLLNRNRDVVGGMRVSDALLSGTGVT